LNTRRFDFLVASMSITEERKRAVDFTDPYYTNKLQFVAPKNSDFKVDNDYLKRKTIGAQRATIAGQWLEENLGDVVTIRLYDTQENAYLDMACGCSERVLGDGFGQYEWLQSAACADFESKRVPVFDEDQLGIAVRRGDQLREGLNGALAEISEGGTYDEINAKHSPIS